MEKLDTIQVNDTDYEICGAKTFTVTLIGESSLWPDNKQTLTDSNFIASGYSYIITPDRDDVLKWINSNITVDNIETDTHCTFFCNRIPTDDITVQVTRVAAL